MENNKKKTRLGIGSWTFPYHCGLGNSMGSQLAVKKTMSPWELIDAAKAYGVDFVQICENRPLDIYSEEELKDIRKYAESKEISLEVGMRGATWENLVHMLEITHILGASLLRCVIDGENYEPEIGEVINTFKRVLPILEKYDVVLGIENHDRFKAREFAYILEQLNDRHYGIVLDTTNSLSQEERAEEVLKELAPYTVCLHFKDYTIVRAAGTVGLEVVGTPVGKGRQNIREILRYLCEHAQSDFSTIIEFWMPYEDDLEKTLKKERMWADTSVLYLQELLGELEEKESINCKKLKNME